MTHLTEHEPDILACSICSYKYSKEACAVYDVVRSEGVAPSGFNHFALGVLKGMTDYTPSAAEQVFNCTVCGACKTNGCVAEGYGDPIDTPSIVQAMRADIVERGLLPEGLRLLAERLKTYGNPYGKPPEQRASWASRWSEPGKKPESLVVVGAAAGYTYPGPGEAALGLLSAAGVNAEVLGPREWDSGNILYSIGDRPGAARAAEKFLQSIAERAADEVVVLDSDDYFALTQLYPVYLGLTVPFKTVHITEYLERLASTGRLSFQDGFSATATYHDPCALGIRSGLYEAPRRLLGRVPGMTLVEMRYSEKRTRSAGTGGGFEFQNPDIAAEVANRRLQQAKRTGAEILVSACPTVEAHLSSCSGAVDGIKVMDVCEVLSAALSGGSG